MILSAVENIENWLIDDMSPKQVRYLTPVAANQANGKLGDIYKQIRRDFQLVPPLTLFSPSTELLAGAWAITRETQIAIGTTPRSLLEAVASAVSTTNECHYCIDAHSGMLHASADHDVVKAILKKDNALIIDEKTRKIVEWALATKKPNAEIIKNPPFSLKEAPKIMGTAVVFHFVNRMVGVFLEPSLLPVPTGSITFRKMATRIFGATFAKLMLRRKSIAGEGLQFTSPSELPHDMQWASEDKNISMAFASFSKLIDELGEKSISEPVRKLIKNYIDNWNGEDAELGHAWLNELIAELNETDKPVAKLALLTAFAPYQVNDNIINNFRFRHPGDEALLYVTAWASFIISRRIGSWLH